jgi:hypothetical protein
VWGCVGRSDNRTPQEIVRGVPVLGQRRARTRTGRIPRGRFRACMSHAIWSASYRSVPPGCRTLAALRSPGRACTRTAASRCDELQAAAAPGPSCSCSVTEPVGRAFTGWRRRRDNVHRLCRHGAPTAGGPRPGSGRCGHVTVLGMGGDVFWHQNSRRYPGHFPEIQSPVLHVPVFAIRVYIYIYACMCTHIHVCHITHTLKYAIVARLRSRWWDRLLVLSLEMGHQHRVEALRPSAHGASAHRARLVGNMQSNHTRAAFWKVRSEPPTCSTVAVTD